MFFSFFWIQGSIQAFKCFTTGPRKSNESQHPMLQQTYLEKHPISVPPSIAAATTITTTTTQDQHLTTLTSSTGHLSRNLRRQHANSTTSCADVNSPHKQKRLRLQLAKERKASTTLGIIMSAFTICWLPFFVLACIRIFLADPDMVPPMLSSVFLWLGYCNSLLNPIIYATLNRDFRKPFREILYFRCSNLQHMMREEFYQSQYGDPVNNYVRSGHESSEIVTGTIVGVVCGKSKSDNICATDSLNASTTNLPSESFLWDDFSSR